jgi:hypothetical protein
VLSPLETSIVPQTDLVAVSCVGPSENKQLNGNRQLSEDRKQDKARPDVDLPHRSLWAKPDSLLAATKSAQKRVWAVGSALAGVLMQALVFFFALD